MTLQRLNIIKWRDENGVNHRFSLLEEMSAKWEEWGKTVGIGATKLDIIKKQYHTNRECMSAAVRVWLQMNSREVCKLINYYREQSEQNVDSTMDRITHLPYSLDQMPLSNSRRIRIVATLLPGVIPTVTALLKLYPD